MFVVRVIVSCFYSLFLSHPVLHSMYRPISFLLFVFICLSRSLFLRSSSLSSSTALVVAFFFFFFSLNIGHSVALLDCGTVLTQGVYLRKTTEESRAQVDPSIVVFSHRPDRLKVVCKS